MGARVALTISVMVLVFVFLAAPFVAHDEVAQAMGIPSHGGRRKTVLPAFYERTPYVRVSMDRGRVVVEAELADTDSKNELLAKASSLYGRDQFVDLVSVVPDLKATPLKQEVALVLPSAGSISSDTVVNLDGMKLSIQGSFTNSQKHERYMNQLEQLRSKGVEIQDKSVVGGQR